jgi:hypothetical protein
MARNFRLLDTALELADAVMERRRSSSLLAKAWRHFRGPRPAAAADGLPTELDASLFQESLRMLESMLAEIDSLAGELPEDARPIGIAARSLVERSIAECRKPIVNAARLNADMKQVSALALAMRERLLLWPWDRKDVRA